MNIITKSVSELSTTEYRACYKANYGESGYMRDELVSCRYGARPGIAIMLWNGPDDKTSSLMGWALLVPVRTHGTVAGTAWTKLKAKYTCEFWIKRQYRKKGYGKIIMNEIKANHDKRPHVFPHDNPSAEFFSSYNVTVTRDDKLWLKRKPKVA